MLSQMVKQTRAIYYANLSSYIESELFNNIEKIADTLHDTAKHGRSEVCLMEIYDCEIRGCCKPKVMWDYSGYGYHFPVDLGTIVMNLNTKWKKQFPGTYISTDMCRVIAHIE